MAPAPVNPKCLYSFSFFKMRESSRNCVEDCGESSAILPKGISNAKVAFVLQEHSEKDAETVRGDAGVD